MVGVRYLVIRYKGGEPVVEYATEFLNRAIEEAERLIVNGERLVSIEVCVCGKNRGYRGSKPSL